MVRTCMLDTTQNLHVTCIATCACILCKLHAYACTHYMKHACAGMFYASTRYHHKSASNMPWHYVFQGHHQWKAIINTALALTEKRWLPGTEKGAHFLQWTTLLPREKTVFCKNPLWIRTTSHMRTLSTTNHVPCLGGQRVFWWKKSTSPTGIHTSTSHMNCLVIVLSPQYKAVLSQAHYTHYFSMHGYLVIH